MTDESILEATIADIGARYRAGALSPVAVTQACLDRIAALDGALNAFILVLEDQALADARTAEQELAEGRDRGPLHGVPVAVKDLVDMARLSSTFASKAEPGYVADRDAALVANLRHAGAVIIGKTNLLEFAYGFVHPDYGQTNNPWHLGRTSGGSSGGSAAAVGAGMCFAAVGTDTGGSIRIPASYCGLVGLKPTYGLVDTAGVFPLSWSLDHAGPLARTAGDAAAMLGAMAGRPFDAASASVKGLRFGVIAAHRDHSEITAATRTAFNHACEILARAGASLKDVDIDGLEQVTQRHLDVMMPEASLIHAERVELRGDGFADATRKLIEQGLDIPATDHVRGQRYRLELSENAAAAFEDVDALLSPSVPFAAPAEDPPISDAEGEMLAITWQNMTGHPAVSLPCGLDGDGLPLGLQITTRHDNDGLALAIAAAYEALDPLPTPPLFKSR